MRVCLIYCKNCGIEYKWQASGQWAQDFPIQYGDPDYCPGCKKAIIDALAKIGKKSILKWISTDIVDLNTLLTWQEENKKEESKSSEEDIFALFPKIERVFPSLYNTQTGKTSRSIHIRGKETHENKIFHGSYWSGTNELLGPITVLARVDLDDNFIKYELE